MGASTPFRAVLVGLYTTPVAEARSTGLAGASRSPPGRRSAGRAGRRPRPASPEASPTGSPSTTPQGTAVTGRPSSAAGEVGTASVQAVVGRDGVEPRRRGRHRRRDEQVVAPGSRSNFSRPAAGAQAGHVRRRRQEEPGEQPCADIGRSRRGGCASSAGARGGLGEHEELRDRRDLVVQRDLGPARPPGARGSRPRTPRRPPGRRARRGSSRRRSAARRRTLDRRSAISSRIRRHSAAVRASGPTVSRLHEVGKTPSVGDEPQRRPVSGDAAEGGRDADGAGRVGAERDVDEAGATAAPLPPLEPPVVCAGFHGFQRRPEVRAVRQRAVGELVRVELADDRRASSAEPATQVASRSGTRWRILDAAVVGMPATSITSLTPTVRSPSGGPACRNALSLVDHGCLPRRPRSIAASGRTIRVEEVEDASRSSSVGETPCKPRFPAAARRS